MGGITESGDWFRSGEEGEVHLLGSAIVHAIRRELAGFCLGTGIKGPFGTSGEGRGGES